MGAAHPRNLEGGRRPPRIFEGGGRPPKKYRGWAAHTHPYGEDI